MTSVSDDTPWQGDIQLPPEPPPTRAQRVEAIRDAMKNGTATMGREGMLLLLEVDQLRLTLLTLRTAVDTVLTHPNPSDVALLRSFLDELAAEEGDR
jgi:hypothetical protein